MFLFQKRKRYIIEPFLERIDFCNFRKKAQLGLPLVLRSLSKILFEEEADDIFSL